MLIHTLVELLRDIRSHAQVAPALVTRIFLAHDVALYTLSFSLQGYDLSFTLGSQILRPPATQGCIRNFQYGECLYGSTRCPAGHPMLAGVCALGGYDTAAEGIGCELTKGHLLPMVATDGSRDRVSLTWAAQMAAA